MLRKIHEEMLAFYNTHLAVDSGTTIKSVNEINNIILELKTGNTTWNSGDKTKRTFAVEFLKVYDTISKTQ